jgi:hypothetical protein
MCEDQEKEAPQVKIVRNGYAAVFVKDGCVTLGMVSLV